MKIVLLLALVAVCLASPSAHHEYHHGPVTREGCPPEGYTALVAGPGLAHLPAYGKYAICNTDTDGDYSFDVLGAFRLSHSILLIDQFVQLNVPYPGRLEWDDVLVEDIVGAGPFSGIIVAGAPADLHPIPHSPPFLSSSRFGNCGSFNDVKINNFGSSVPFVFQNCSGATPPVKGLTIFGGNGDSLVIQDSTHLAFYDLDITANTDAVQIENSVAAFVKPSIVAPANAFDVRSGSRVTVCDGFLHSDLNGGGLYQLGSGLNPDDEPVTVAVAGKFLPSNIFPDQIEYQGQGGILFTLARCPSPIFATYDSRMWLNSYPGSAP